MKEKIIKNLPRIWITIWLVSVAVFSSLALVLMSIKFTAVAMIAMLVGLIGLILIVAWSD